MRYRDMALDSLLKQNESELIRVGNLVYSSHGLQRLKERGLFPAVIEDTLNMGDKYGLKSAYPGTKGATEAYVKMHSAKVGKKSNIVSIVVLVDDKQNVKTVHVCRDKELRSFLRNDVK